MPRMLREVTAKPKKAIPHAFILDALSHLQPFTRPMFSCLAVYVGDKIVLALRNRQKCEPDDGVWLCTTEEHHASLRAEFPNMRSISVFGRPVSGWQVLPMDSPDFEAAALHACELIAHADPRIGKIPKLRNRKKSSQRTHV